MTKTDENLNISVDSQLICTKLPEQDFFFWARQNESKESYAMIKTDKNLNISAEIGFRDKVTFWFWEILFHVDHSVLL